MKCFSGKNIRMNFHSPPLKFSSGNKKKSTFRKRLSVDWKAELSILVVTILARISLSKTIPCQLLAPAPYTHFDLANNTGSQIENNRTAGLLTA